MEKTWKQKSMLCYDSLIQYPFQRYARFIFFYCRVWLVPCHVIVLYIQQIFFLLLNSWFMVNQWIFVHSWLPFLLVYFVFFFCVGMAGQEGDPHAIGNETEESMGFNGQWQKNDEMGWCSCVRAWACGRNIIGVWTNFVDNIEKLIRLRVMNSWIYYYLMLLFLFSFFFFVRTDVDATLFAVQFFFIYDGVKIAIFWRSCRVCRLNFMASVTRRT